MAAPGGEVPVGRRAEMARMEAALERARSGQPIVVAVTGEAGIGKTTLVEALASHAAEDGWLRIGGTCLELHGSQIAFLPFVEALRSLVAQMPPERIRPLVWGAREALGRLLPELTGGSSEEMAAGATGAARRSGIEDLAAGGEGGQLDRARLFESLLVLARTLAGTRPLMVVIEDIQWIDADSLDLLRFFVHNVRSGPVMLILTLRTEGPGNPAGMFRELGELERIGRLERVDLGPLERDDVAALLAAVDGRPPDPANVARLTARSGGNPFFVEELARMGDAAAATNDGPTAIPADLRDLLLARMAALEPEAQGILRIVSAAGRAVDEGMLERVAGLPEGDVVRGLRSAIDHGLLIRTGSSTGDGYAFRHPLVREVVEGSLLPLESRRLHAAFAEALAANLVVRAAPPAGVAAEIAFHWDAAGEPGRALEASVAAAIEAEAVFAFEEANAQYERALRLWSLVPYADDRLPIDRSTIIDRAAATAALIGRTERAVRLAREALADVDPETDPERAALFHSRLRWYLWDAGEPEAALEDALAAVRLTPLDPPTTMGANVHGHAAGLLLFTGQPVAAEREAETALTLARGAGARAEEALALGVLGWLAVQRGEDQRGIGLVRQALDIARELGHVVGLQLAYNHLAAVLDLTGRVAESLGVAREGIAEAERLGTARSFGALLEGNAAHALLRLGRWPEADAMTAAALARGAVGGALAWLRVIRARLDIARGRSVEADGELRALEASADAVGLTPYLGWWHVARAEAAVWAGDPESALAIVGAALEDDRLPAIDASMPALAAIGIRAAADIVETSPVGSQRTVSAREAGTGIHERVRRLRRARRLETPDLPTEGPRAAPGLATSRVTLVEAESTRLDGPPNPAAWRRLIRAAEAEDRAPLAAYGRWRLAAALLAARGDRDEVAGVLVTAHASAVELGAAPLVAVIEDLARRARIRLGPADVTDVGSGEVFGLTERELEVLALVVAGRSNREIGEDLFISPKTASVHVSNILAKMGVDGRLEAATLALRMGLVPPPDVAVRGGSGRD